MKLKIVFFLTVFALASSAHAELLSETILWDTTPMAEAEYTPYLQTGKNTLVGQAFLTQNGGGVVKAAGREVTLDPETSIGTDWWTRAGTKWRSRSEVHSSPNFRKARRVVIADADGKFTFKNIPAGRYYLRTDVTWEVASQIQGGLIGKLVEIKEGETAEIILGNLNQIAVATYPPIPPAHAPAPAPVSVHAPTLTEMLNSSVPQDMKVAAMEIYKYKKYQPDLLTLLHSTIEKDYKQPLNAHQIEAIVWLCRALAGSGATEHKALIEDVAENATEAKVRSHVKKYLAYYK